MGDFNPGADPMQAYGGPPGGYGPPGGGPPGGYGPPGGGGPGGYGPPGGGGPPGGYGPPGGGGPPGGYGPPGGGPPGGGPPGGGGYGGPPGGGPPGGGGYGGPPGGGGYGGPPGGGPPGGGPPGGGGYGGPPGGGGYGGPPGGGGYGGPPGGGPPGYGAPMQAPPQGQFGAAPMMGPPMGMGAPMGGPTGPRPTRRNAVMTLLIPLGIIFGANILGGIMAAVIDPIVGSLFNLLALVGSVILLISFYKMLTELKAFTNNPDFNWWFILIPCLNYYFLWIKVPEEVTKAKQMAGLNQPARSILAYIFVAPYALAADLNDIAG